jgi:hypothetical protein
MFVIRSNLRKIYLATESINHEAAFLSSTIQSITPKPLHDFAEQLNHTYYISLSYF